MTLWTVVLLCVLILINALYVAAEFSLVGARVTRVEQLAVQGNRLAGLVLPVLRDAGSLDRHIAACQIGITVSSLVLGAFGQATLGLTLGALLVEQAGLNPVSAFALSASIALVALTSVQVILGELIPKTVALQYPVGTALYTFLPLRWSVLVFTPFIFLLNGSGSFVLRCFGVTTEASHRHVHSPEEIDLLIRESREGGLLAHQQSKRLREALQLGKHRVRQLMVARRQIMSLDLQAPLEYLQAEIHASPYTRILVYSGDPNELRGYIHVKDVAYSIARGHDLRNLHTLVRPLLVLPSSLTIDRALGQLRDQHARIAVLVDEYGEVEGLISLEDIIRELLGELSDEFKSLPGLEPLPLDDGRWRLPGRLPMDDASEWARTHGVVLGQSGQVETLAGWLLEKLDSIPQGRCCLRSEGLEFEIEALEGVAITSVLVQPPVAQPREDVNG